MRLKLLIVLSVLFVCRFAYASEHLCFDHYRTQDGLCCDYVLGIGQDSNGFVWVTTQNGVSRFDGTYFKNYSKDRGGLIQNNVKCVTNTVTGDIFLGGDNGLLQSYDIHTDTFFNRRFPELMGKYVKSVSGFSRLRDGRDLLLTTSGVFPYDTLNRCFAADSFFSNFTIDFYVNSFYQDKQGNYWIGAFDGLHIFSPKGEELKFHLLSKDKAPASSILELDSTHVLVATNMGGIWLFDASGHDVPVGKEFNAPFKNVSAMLKDAKNRVWFGTWGHGLWRMDSLGKFVEIKPYGDDEALKKVHALYEDSEQSIWVGTQINGLFRHQAESSSKILHSSMIGYPNVDASCFWERPDGSLFVGSDGSGAYLVDSEGRFVQQMKSFDKMGRSILCFNPWKKDTSLVSSWFGGVGKVAADGEVTPIPYGNLKNTINSSKCVRLMKNGEIWVATQGDSVYVRHIDGLWEKISLKINKDITDLWVEEILENQDETKWLVAPFNVWLCDSINKRRSSLEENNNANDPCVLIDGACDEAGNLYVASTSGILFVSKETGELTKLDFLPKTYYMSVHFDKQGLLWCDGTEGILRVNLKNQTFRKIPLSEDKYGKLSFQPRAIYETSKGNMFFGCSNGFIMMNAYGDGSSGLIKFLSWAKAAERKSDGKWSSLCIKENRLCLDGDNEETHISFDVVSLSGMDIVCRYRLKGLDSTWITLNEEREIVLRHLPAGNYELELSACKDGKEERASYLHLDVEVSALWWQSWWLVAIVTLALLTSLYGLRTWLKRNKISVSDTADVPEDEVSVDPFMEQVMTVIEQNYMNSNFNVEDLAKELGTSKSTLIRRLKPMTNLTPVELIGIYRLNKADEMLRTSNVPIKEVAFLTGFSSQYYFSRKYKEHFGYPPSQQKV